MNLINGYTNRQSQRAYWRPLHANSIALLTFAIASATTCDAGVPANDYSASPGANYCAYQVRVPTPAGNFLAGTLTLPQCASACCPVGAIVTVTGSGPQDRDENLGFGGFKPFRQLAEALAERNIAVLRMDDRGVGESEGVFKGATTVDFAEDVRAGLAYLRTRCEIDCRRLGVVGHSEGALIAPLVAQNEPSLRAMVLLAGVADPPRNALHFQIQNGYEHDQTLTEKKRAELIASIPAKIDEMMVDNPWMKFFLTYDPADTMRRVKTPVLILTGEHDQQAAPDQVELQAEAFRAAGNRDVTARVLPNLNHLLVYDKDGFPGNYAKLPPPIVIHNSAIELISDWLSARIGRHTL
jgi:alpha-beta hydrolase superfamily lysophospholipase